MIYFLKKGEKFIYRFNEILEKVSKLIKKQFNSELVYNKELLKAKKRSTQKKDFNVFLHE